MDAAQLTKKDPNPKIPTFAAGDTVRVNFRIREGERERIQAFQGVVIRLQNGNGPAGNFTVRRISNGIGIERIFPIHSPLIESLEVTRYGSVRRAKLYYLRGLQGRAARIKERSPLQRRKAAEQDALAAAQAAAVAEAAAAEPEAEPAEELTEQPADEIDEQPVDTAAEEGPSEADEPPANSPEETPEETEDPPQDSPEESEQ